MGQLERDAKRLGMELASDPLYGKATGCFWGGLICLGAVGWVIGWLIAGAKQVTSAGWVALAVGSGLLVLVVFRDSPQTVETSVVVIMASMAGLLAPVPGRGRLVACPLFLLPGAAVVSGVKGGPQGRRPQGDAEHP